MKTIHATQLAERHHRLLDVRTTGEFDSHHIAGSHNLPLDQLRRHAHRVGVGEGPLVLVCRSGQRAEQAARLLREAGHDDHVVLEGGITEYRRHADVVDGRERWELERQIRLVAGSIVTVSTLLSLRWPRARFAAGAIGAGLAAAAITNTCLMGAALSRLPYNRTRSVNADQVLADLHR